MFRIRKDDYNTVELIPEYRSTTKNKNSSLQSSNRGPGSFLPVLIAVLVVVLLAAGGFGGYYLYTNYFNPSSQYVQMFNSQNKDACITLMKENGDNEKFIAGIKETVVDTIYQVQRDYKAGKIDAEEALKALAEYDEITADHFTDITKSISSFINNNEKLKTDLDAIKSLCSKNDITGAYDSIKKLKEDAAVYGIDVTEDITAVIKDNLDAFKYVYFRQAATSINNRSYEGIRSTLKDINSYVNDSDIEEMLKTIDSAEKGDLTKSKARAYALEQADKFVRQTPGDINDKSSSKKSKVTSEDSSGNSGDQETADSSGSSGTSGSSAKSGTTDSTSTSGASGTSGSSNTPAAAGADA
ncbi:MAG: hypothetical protein K5767_05400 [Clostridia bacterium]|nr:hypothetical protein [Clostridia bacterium]